MSGSEALLAVDLGAESGRAVVGRFDGRKLEVDEIHRFPNQPVALGPTLYWDILGLLANTEFAIGKAAAEASLRSVGIDSWGVDFGLLDRRGQLVANPVHYRDRRTEGMIQRACEALPREVIFSATGNMFLELNTLYQLLALRLSDDPALQIARRLLNIPDLLHYWLSGMTTHELTIASTTQCLAASRSDWAWDVLRQLDIPAHLFGEIVASGTRLGPLRSNGRTSVVTPASHDTASAVMAVPGQGDEGAWISSGTWSVGGVLTDHPVITPDALERNFTNEAAGDGRNRFCRNVMGLWILQECRREWAQEGRTFSYEELVEMARQSASVRSLVNPDDPRFFRPGRMLDTIRQYCTETGQPVPQSAGEIARCIFESLALAYRRVLAWTEEMTGRQIERVHIVGGGSRNTMLCQFTASAAGKKVITGPAEATAIGNLLCQAMAHGWIGSSTEAAEVVRRSFPVEELAPTLDDRWEEAWERFQRLSPP